MSQFVDASITNLVKEYHTKHPGITLEVVERGNAYFVRFSMSEMRKAVDTQPGTIKDTHNLMSTIKSLTDKEAFLEAKV